MSNGRAQSGGNGGGPSAFSMYASRFLNGNVPRETAVEGSQVSILPHHLALLWWHRLSKLLEMNDSSVHSTLNYDTASVLTSDIPRFITQLTLPRPIPPLSIQYSIPSPSSRRIPVTIRGWYTTLPRPWNRFFT
jgi:hypothetical protein